MTGDGNERGVSFSPSPVSNASLSAYRTCWAGTLKVNESRGPWSFVESVPETAKGLAGAAGARSPLVTRMTSAEVMKKHRITHLFSYNHSRRHRHRVHPKR